MLASPPNYTPTEFRPLTTHTVRTIQAFDSPDYSSGFNLNARAFALIQDFKSLKKNWDGEGALPPDTGALRKAETLTRTLQGFGQKIFHVAPGPNGEIMIDLRANGNSVEILFYPKETRFVKFPANGMPEQGEFSDLTMLQILAWLNG